VSREGGPGTGRPPVLAHFGRFGEGLLPVLRAAVAGEEFALYRPDTPAADGPPADAEILVALVSEGSDIGAAIGPAIRWVHVLGAGIDGFPLDLAGDRMITCSRGASAPAIAEFVLAGMLAFEKQLPQSWITSPPEHWNTGGLGGLSGRTVGIIGLGAIGTEVARRALAFDMRVLAFRRRPEPSSVPGVEVAGTLVELLGQSDHVVVAAPATAQTRHLLDATAFESVKQGAHLVNVARGTLVDQDAMLAALDGGRLAMATLDVVEPEPLPAGHPLFGHPRVRLSPHISWSSPDTIRRTIDLFVENLRRYRAGEPLQGVVDVAAGY
jgi:phosphoglycerate dehydrogenase-like enzyme